MILYTENQTDTILDEFDYFQEPKARKEKEKTLTFQELVQLFVVELNKPQSISSLLAK
jgi:hypothetical protein